MEAKVKNGKRKRHSDDGEWDCTLCTFKNNPKDFRCVMCNNQRGTSTRRNAQNTKQQYAQQELEDMLKRESRRKGGSKSKNSHREHSMSISIPSPAGPSAASSSRISSSPGRTSLEDGSLTSPAASTSSYRHGPKRRSPTASTSQRSDSPISRSSDLPSVTINGIKAKLPKKLNMKKKVPKPLTVSCKLIDAKVVVNGNGEKKKKEKNGKHPSNGLKVPDDTKPSRTRGVIFPINHEGVQLEFEEYDPSDVSDEHWDSDVSSDAS